MPQAASSLGVHDRANPRAALWRTGRPNFKGARFRSWDTTNAGRSGVGAARIFCLIELSSANRALVARRQRQVDAVLAKFIAAWREGKAVGVPDNEIRSPIDVISLGAALLELATNEFTGVVHLSGNDILDRHTMARRIAVKLGFDEALVQVNNPENIPGRAPRPRDVSLDNAVAREILRTPLPGIEGGLDQILEVEKRKTS